MKRIFLDAAKILSFIALLISSGLRSQNADIMMQGWYWDYPKTVDGANWADTLKIKTTELGQAGFTFLWLPPLSRTSSGPWSNGYDPKDLFDYGEFGQGATGFGTRADLDELVAALDTQNINPVADLVYNHRDGGSVEDNPGLKNYIVSFFDADKINNNGAQPFPYDRMRVVLPLGGTSGNNAGDYYFKFRSKSQHSNYHNWEYQIYMFTDVVGWQGLDPLNESEPNGGGDCSEPFNVISLGRHIHGNIDSDGCGIDEFKLTLTEDDFNATGDAIYIEFNGRNSGYSDLYIHGIWSATPGADIVDDLYYQTYTNYNWVPSGRGEMNWSFFKPNLDRNTYLTGDWDGMFFYYDYDQFQPQTRDSLFAWTRWNWSDVGIRGLRVDAVKHFSPEFMGDLLDNLYDNGMYPPMVVGEWYGTNTNELAGWVNNVYGYMNEATRQEIAPRIFDFSLRESLRQACDQFGYDVRAVFGQSIVDQGKLNGLNVVTFVNNHDFRCQSGFASLIHNDPILAYAYILTNNQIGAPSVFYPDYFGYPAEGQPGYKDYHPSDKAPLKSQINNLMGIHNQYIYGANNRIYLNNYSGGLPNSLGDGNANVLVYQLKGDAGFKDVVVAINFSGSGVGFSQGLDGFSLETMLEDLTGNANVKNPTVENANGINNSIWIDLPQRSYAVYRAGAWGMWQESRSNITFNVDGEPETFTVWDGLTGNIHGHDFGTFTTNDVLQMSAFDIKTWKNSGADVTGGDFYYTIYHKGQRPESPLFQNQAISWIEDIDETGNQKWGFEGEAINLLSGLLPGEYTVEFYAQMNGTDPDKSVFDSNEGNNYISHFRYNYVRSSSDGSWNATTTWVDEVIPDNDAISAEVKHNIELPDTKSVYDLLLLDGSLTLNPDAMLTVTNTFSSSLAQIGLILESSASATASLIHTTANIPATIQRYVAGGWGAWDEGWHLISSPVVAQPIGDFATTGTGNDYDFYGWNETTNTWMNFKDDDFVAWNGSPHFNPGQGYLISYEQTQPGRVFTGNINVADKLIYGLTYSENNGNGWQLLGNPYSSALVWNDGNWALSNVAGTAKIWSSTQKSYSDIGPGGIIPSAQGFMIQVSASDNSVTIPSAARTHSNLAWYKSNDEKILLIAREAGGTAAQESTIRIDINATAGFDFYHDSRFLPGYAPLFYSVADNERLSTNTLPVLTETTSIPFGFEKNDADEFEIELLQGIPDTELILSDLKLGTEHNLSKSTVYPFTSVDGDDPIRFVLHAGAVGTHDKLPENQPFAFFSNGQLVVKSADAKAHLQIYDMQGRMLQSHQLSKEGMYNLPLNLASGIYLVRLISHSKSTSVKLVVP